MTDKEKVLKGVRRHFNGSATCPPDCPYNKDDDCLEKLATDVEALINTVPDENATFYRLVAEKTDLMNQITELKEENKSIIESHIMLLKLCLIVGGRK